MVRDTEHEWLRKEKIKALEIAIAILVADYEKNWNDKTTPCAVAFKQEIIDGLDNDRRRLEGEVTTG